MADGDARETAKTAHEGEVPSTSQSSGAGTGEAAAPGSCSNNTALCFNVGDHTEAITQVVDEYLKKELKKTITQVVDEHVPKYTAAQLRAAREAGAEEARAEAAEGAAAFKRKVSSLDNRTLPLQHSSIASNLFESGNTPLEVLHSVFGHDNFRPYQLEAIEHVLSGKDVIVVMPTGGGKTIIYAVPSLILPGMAIVISPLMMLMCDQVARLRRHGINACYYTLLSDNERQNIIHNLMQPGCQYQFIFISPETSTSDQFQSCLHKLSQDKRLSLIIIDEAHCVDTWGSNFRPYQQLGILKKFGLPIVALTATVTNETLTTIADVLHMQNNNLSNLQTISA